MKDIQNLPTQTTKEHNSNELDAVVNFLQKDPNSTIEVMVNKDNDSKCLFYQDEKMKTVLAMFPELLMVDATYKLLDLKQPVYVLLAIDGHSLSEIVGLFIVAEETGVTIESAVEYFKKHNSAWERTKLVISDKDFTDRNVFRKCPGVVLQICLLHTLRTFKREITMDKMSIMSGERNRCLEILTKITYSRSPEEYQFNLSLLKSTKNNSVVSYFLKNWDRIKDQWVPCFKDTALNLGETTNNRLESINSKIKSVCSKYGSLLQFFYRIFRRLRSTKK